MGPPSYKQFTLMLPVQIHLRHFDLGNLVHLLVALMFFSGPALGDMSIHVMHFYNQLL